MRFKKKFVRGSQEENRRCEHKFFKNGAFINQAGNFKKVNCKEYLEKCQTKFNIVQNPKKKVTGSFIFISILFH